MSNEKSYGNQPAFPTQDTIHPETGARFEPINSGLTKREYFAAMAMQGLLCTINNPESKHLVNGGFLHHGSLALESTQMADALLHQLNLPQ